MIPGCVENSLCLEHAEEIPATVLIACPRTLERSLAFVHIQLLRLPRLIEVMLRAQRVLNVDKGGNNGGFVLSEHLLLLCSSLPTLGAQLAGVEYRLSESCSEVQRRSRAA